MSDTATQEETLRVSSGTNAQKLAGAISNALTNSSKEVVVAAIGAGAVNQAVKALVIARQMVSTRGRDLYFIPGMESTPDTSRPGSSGSSDITRIIFRARLS